MKSKRLSRRTALGVGAATLAAGLLPKATQAAEASKVLVLVGPSKHPPGTHEVAAGGRLLKHCIEKAGLTAEVVEEWPKDTKGVSSIVFIGDYFPPAVMPNGDKVMAELAKLMDAGCGMVCIHYATGLTAGHVPQDGDHPLLRWMGGYFASKCPHHQSVAKVFKNIDVKPGEGGHPVLRGWKGFTFDDEPYIQNYFGKDGMAKNVTPLATAMLPPEAPKKEAIAWGIERKDGGRGVAVVMPHFYRNWKLDDLRTLILNAVVWTAKQEVPKDGVKVELPDLLTFKPTALEPIPAKKK